MSDYQKLLKEYNDLKERYGVLLNEIACLKTLFIEIRYLINKYGG